MLKFFLFTVALLTHFSLFADTSPSEALERQMWEYMANHKWNEFENRIAPYFQADIFDGPRNKEQFVNRAKVLDISNTYSLSNFSVTEGPEIIVMTYDAQLSETIEGKRLTSKAIRLSVWHKENNNWLWAAHAVLIPVPAHQPTPKAIKSAE